MIDHRVIAHRNSVAGYTYALVAVCAFVLVGMFGMALDIARIYITKNELQIFADSASVAAAYELDGTSSGITQADAIGSTGPSGASGTVNGWNFSTTTLSGAQVTFARNYGDSYAPSGAAPNNSMFVRVRATATPNIMFLRAIPGIPSSINIAAVATAGQAAVGTPGRNVDPFSPDAIDAGSPNFGFTKGQQYNMKWAPPGQRDKTGGNCAGDLAADHDAAGGSADRGYINLGQGDGNSALYDAIVNRDFGADPVILHIGDPINTVTGNKNVGPALQNRIDQDTDQTSGTYSSYTGNGRRIFNLAVNDSTLPGTVIGFASFFLPPNTGCLTHNNDACCGEYIGVFLTGSNNEGAGTPGTPYAVKLFR